MKHTLELTDTPIKKVKTELNLSLLPEEILIKIASFLNQHDTFSLLLTNKAFNKPSKIRLYKKILICEKYEDTFFYKLSKYQYFTLLSSWNNILKFFRFIYMNVKNNENLEIVEYIEEIGSFNYLDCGKLDPHRYLLKSDLQNILSFRQYWEIVLNEFKNLKRFNFPKIPIEKLYSLKNDIRVNLIELSINLDNGSDLKFKNLILPNLIKLRLNLETERLNKSIIDVIITILSNDDGHNNYKLQELEINGKFGKLDRDLEHSLRHHNWLNDVNLRSSFMKGFDTAELLYKYEKPIESFYNRSANGRAQEMSDDGDAEDEDDDDDESFDEVYDNVHLDDETNEEEDDDEDIEEKLNPILTNVEFTKDKFNGFNNKDNDNDKFSSLIIELAHHEVVLHNLKKFTLSNITLNSNYHDLFRNSLKLLIPNLVSLKELSFKNVYSEIVNINGDQNSENNLFSRYSNQCLTNIFITELFDELNKLTYFSTPVPINNKLLSNNTEFSIKDFQVIELMNLQQILENSPNLNTLKFFASNNIKLIDLYYSLLDSNNSQNLTRIIYLKPIEILSICRKLLNVKIFKRFKSFNNLKIIDDYYFGISKQIIEYFNSIARIDEYSGNSDYYKHLTNDEKFLFNDEFNYLFKDDVKKFFIKFKNLKEFVYFGYTFERSDMKI